MDLSSVVLCAVSVRKNASVSYHRPLAEVTVTAARWRCDDDVQQLGSVMDP